MIFKEFKNNKKICNIYMIVYYCEYCDYYAKQKSHYQKHILSKKHKCLKDESTKVNNGQQKVNIKSTFFHVKKSTIVNTKSTQNFEHEKIQKNPEILGKKTENFGKNGEILEKNGEILENFGKNGEILEKNEEILENSEFQKNLEKTENLNFENFSNSDDFFQNFKKVLKNSENHEILTNFNDSKNFCCKYCEKRFTTKQSMYRHIKYTCKKNKDEDIKEFARLLNEKDSQIENMQKQIDRLSKKLQIRDINNNVFTQNNITQNNTIINNIQLYDYNKPDLSHLTYTDYKKAINENNHCVPALVKMIHFNKEKPENMNIYIPYMKDKYIYIVKNGVWVIKEIKDILPSFYEDNFMILQEWFIQHKDEINKQLNKQFTRLENQFQDENIKNKLLATLKEILYNQRELPKVNRNLIENDD